MCLFTCCIPDATLALGISISDEALACSSLDALRWLLWVKDPGWAGLTFCKLQKKKL